MEKFIQKVEQDESCKLATEIAETINGYLSTNGWDEAAPFSVQMLDQQKNIAYIYDVTRQADHITIREQASNNPRLVQTFNLDKNAGQWTYCDPYLIKYKESSLDQLSTAYERLKMALTTPTPNSLDNSKLISSETE